MLRVSTVVRPCALLVAGVVALAGCGNGPGPLAPGDDTNNPSTPTFRSSGTEVLVPDGDLTQYVGWPAYPGDPAEAWSKIDEGVANLDVYDFIYALDDGLVERLTFTDLSVSGVYATKLEFVVPMNVGLDQALSAGVTLRYYIDDEEEGSATYQCGEIPGIECGDTTWVATFDGVCYTDQQMATLEVELESVGTWWYPEMTSVVIPALDCDVTYDDDLTISNVQRSFDGLNCEAKVTWDTNLASSSTVHWGYSLTSLPYVATGAGNTTSHTVTIDASGISVRTRIYTKAESATDCDTAQSGTGFVYRQYCISQ